MAEVRRELMRSVREGGATIGVSDHGRWAVLVTINRDRTLLDRRHIELVDPGLPKIPHHSECQRLPIAEAVALVERVQASAERRAEIVLEEVALMLSRRGIVVAGIELRQCPKLPPTI